MESLYSVGWGRKRGAIILLWATRFERSQGKQSDPRLSILTQDALFKVSNRFKTAVRAYAEQPGTKRSLHLVGTFFKRSFLF